MKIGYVTNDRVNITLLYADNNLDLSSFIRENAVKSTELIRTLNSLTARSMRLNAFSYNPNGAAPNRFPMMK